MSRPTRASVMMVPDADQVKTSIWPGVSINTYLQTQQEKWAQCNWRLTTYGACITSFSICNYLFYVSWWCTHSNSLKNTECPRARKNAPKTGELLKTGKMMFVFLWKSLICFFFMYLHMQQYINAGWYWPVIVLLLLYELHHLKNTHKHLLIILFCSVKF